MSCLVLSGTDQPKTMCTKAIISRVAPGVGPDTEQQPSRMNSQTHRHKEKEMMMVVVVVEIPRERECTRFGSLCCLPRPTDESIGRIPKDRCIIPPPLPLYSTHWELKSLVEPSTKSIRHVGQAGQSIGQRPDSEPTRDGVIHNEQETCDETKEASNRPTHQPTNE